MNVLPRLTHIISSIPLVFPLTWFQEIKSLFISFLWHNKKPRIAYRKLIIPRDKGGLGAPDLYQYYLAYNAKYLLAWAYESDNHPPSSWEWIEKIAPGAK